MRIFDEDGNCVDERGKQIDDNNDAKDAIRIEFNGLTDDRN